MSTDQLQNLTEGTEPLQARRTGAQPGRAGTGAAFGPGVHRRGEAGRRTGQYSDGLDTQSPDSDLPP